MSKAKTENIISEYIRPTHFLVVVFLSTPKIYLTEERKHVSGTFFLLLPMVAHSMVNVTDTQGLKKKNLNISEIQVL